MRGRRALLAAATVVGLLLGACATRSPDTDRDGPPARVPPGLDRVPDAVPRVEPLRQGGPNKPYQVFGRTHVPMTVDAPLQETGGASWYGRKFHGRPTASGEIYDMFAMTAAHKTMPIPSYARVRNPANGREVIVRINDRGPFASGRVIDLSYTAALKLGLLGGVAPVQVQRITHAEIRAGVTPAAVQPAAPEARAAGVALPPDDPAPGELPTEVSGFWLQLGAFRQRQGAQLMQQRALSEVGLAVPGVRLFEEQGLLRVQAGPFASREQASQAAQRVRQALGVDALVLQRR